MLIANIRTHASRTDKDTDTTQKNNMAMINWLLTTDKRMGLQTEEQLKMI